MQGPLYILRGVLPAVVANILARLDTTMHGNVRYQIIGMYFIIIQLFDSGQEATITELAHIGQITKPYTSELANTLYRLGWIDRISIRVPQGRGRQYSYKPVHDAERLQRMLGTLTPSPVMFSTPEGDRRQPTPGKRSISKILDKALAKAAREV